MADFGGPPSRMNRLEVSNWLCMGAPNTRVFPDMTYMPKCSLLNMYSTCKKWKTFIAPFSRKLRKTRKLGFSAFFTFSHYGDVVARGSIVFTKKIKLLILLDLQVSKVRIQKKWFLGVDMSVCLSVCLSVCVINISKTTGPIWTIFWI